MGTETKAEGTEEKKRQDEHEARMKREQEAHDLSMEEGRKRMERHEATDKAGIALMMVLAKLGGTADELLQVAKVQYEFQGRSAIRAVACDLIRQAAEKKGTPEALEAAAARLLEIAGPDQSVGPTMEKDVDGQWVLSKKAA